MRAGACEPARATGTAILYQISLIGTWRNEGGLGDLKRRNAGSAWDGFWSPGRGITPAACCLRPLCPEDASHGGSLLLLAPIPGSRFPDPTHRQGGRKVAGALS